METKKIESNSLKIKPSAGSAFAFESPLMMPKCHQNMIIVGARGAGKSTALVNFIEKMNVYDRLFIISPTMVSNRELMKRLKVNDEDVENDPNDIRCLDRIQAKIQAEADDWDQYLEDLKKWKSFDKKLRSTNSLFSNDELMSFFKGGDFKEPKSKYGHKPCLGLVIDDCLGSALFSKGSRALNHMVILHRHLGQLKKTGGALGCSLYFLVQSYKCQTGGLTKSIRNNATTLILFKTKSQKELDEISEEVGAEVAKETFMKIAKACFIDKHDFMLIDLHYKPEHASPFRRNLDCFLIAPPEED